MNADTGEIKSLSELTKKDIKSGKWIEIPEEHRRHLEGLSRKNRRDYLKKNGIFKKGRWGFLKRGV